MLWTDHQKRPGSHISREIYRERCRDEKGKRYSVIVYEDEIGVTTYRLEDGTEVRDIDGSRFEIAESGQIISRCED